MAEKAKKHPRTVHMTFAMQLEVEDLNAGPGRVRTTHPFKARSVDFPQIHAYGATQEGALVECEDRLNDWLRERIKELVRGNG